VASSWKASAGPVRPAAPAVKKPEVAPRGAARQTYVWMGSYNSSKTRVRPFFHDLIERDPTGETWLEPLLALPDRSNEAVPDPGHLLPAESAWDDPPRKERLLPPPRALLRWLIENPPSVRPRDLQTRCPRKRQKRERLLVGDERVRREALALLDAAPAEVACSCELARPRCREDWHILEGPTHVDAYLTTERFVILIEGKRTEPEPTTRTSWMSVRHQMLRNLDDAWDRRDSRSAIGFFLVEGHDDNPLVLPKEWSEWSANTVSPSALERSLPHRSAVEHRAIASAFLGAATWDAACLACGREPFSRAVLGQI
jgi:hypothetical protein